ncbi:MAG TPA: type 1 glutamine amidotransferase [Solirubrobacterales bacterium]|jgi:GMP synthase (glutamine-hydrolysing)|nr:type 1 glutamine amidotransferase [Solirubrobacterales bacterium]
MSPDRRSTLLAVRNVPWETPHRILDSCGDLEVHHACPLEGDPLPSHEEVAGAVVMGGPMNVEETDRYPGLGTTRDWLAEAVRREMPVLGICLGAQLLARALGAAVVPGERQEIGFAPVTVADPADPVLGGLAPSSSVLHWHGDAFELPAGATHLASSASTAHQAFRLGNAWGVLFHPEADVALAERWMATPEMSAEAIEVLGEVGAGRIVAQAAELEEQLIAATTPGFEAFAALVRGGGA